MRSSTKIVLAMVGVGMLLAGATLVSLFVWRGVGQDGTEAPAELRTYQVPADYQDDLRDMLRSALGTGDTRLGRVTNGPGGTLLVVAPPRLQRGVQQILDAGFEVPPVASPVTLSYWFLVGRPAESSGATTPFSVIGRRAPPQLEPVLAQIAAAQGPTEFWLLEEVQLTSMPQNRAVTSSRFVQVAQRATRTGEEVVADIEISFGTYHLESRVSLWAGQLLVLGQSGFDGRVNALFGNPVDAFPDTTSEDLLTLYYVMAADLEP